MTQTPSPQKTAPIFAFVKPKRPVKKIFVHCSATDNDAHDNIAWIRKLHTSPDPNDASKPWADVGYHFFIRKNGMIEKGRDLEMVPSAQKGHNTGSIAICLAGLTKEKFTQAQFHSLRMLVASIHAAYRRMGINITAHGHCEVANKACPVFDYKRVLFLDPAGNINVADLEERITGVEIN